MGNGCRLVLQERIRPALEDASFNVDGELCALRIQNGFDILTFQSLADAVGLTEQMNITMRCDLANEGHTSSGNGQWLGWHHIARGQFLQFLRRRYCSGVKPPNRR